MAYVQYPNGETYETKNPQHFSGARIVSPKVGKAAMKAKAVEMLRKYLDVRPVAYTILRHVSSTGMTRRISVLAVDMEGGIVDLSGYAARALGWKRHDPSGAVVVSGCGMDMGFHLVDSLGWVMYGEDVKARKALTHRWL